MSLLHAFFCVMYIAGVCSLAYFIGEFLALHQHHRIVRRRSRRRWPRAGFEQHRSFFSDCKRQFPDEY